MNSIWHTADETPDPCRILICKTNKGQNYTAIIPSPQEWNTMILPEFYSLGDIDNAERIEQYAYLDDLLTLETELERTRKVLDKAKWWLNEIVESHRCTPISTAEIALKEITALDHFANASKKVEQKD